MLNGVMESRHVKLRDLPRVRRLVERGAFLDSELGLTRDTSGMLSSLFLPQRSVHTLLSRYNRQAVVGQFRLKADETVAQMTYIAPRLEPDAHNDTIWLHLLDAVTAEAGRQRAHILTAEVEDGSALFQTMRTAGFAVYSRQAIWRRLPDQPLVASHIAHLTRATQADSLDVQLLYCQIVPRLVQPIAEPSAESAGWVYRENGVLRGYVAVSESKHGIYMMPYLHPDVVFHEAAAVLAGVVARTSRAQQTPVYVCVRRYQEWLEETLMDMGFEPWLQQALMARHLTAGVRQASFAPLRTRLEALHAPVRPPTAQIVEPSFDNINRN
jgi:hypothetical protein